MTMAAWTGEPPHAASAAAPRSRAPNAVTAPFIGAFCMSSFRLGQLLTPVSHDPGATRSGRASTQLVGPSTKDQPRSRQEEQTNPGPPRAGHHQAPGGAASPTPESGASPNAGS